MTFEQLTSRHFNEAELGDDNEGDVICKVARDVFYSGAAEYARRIFNREADRHPRVFFALFFSRAWPQPEPDPQLWAQVLAEMGLA